MAALHRPVAEVAIHVHPTPMRRHVVRSVSGFRVGLCTLSSGRVSGRVSVRVSVRGSIVVVVVVAVAVAVVGKR